MPRVVVDVMLKPEIADPQGQAIAKALGSLGVTGVTSVRQGKRFELELAADGGDSSLETMNRVAETLLANPVIETYQLRVEQ